MTNRESRTAVPKGPLTRLYGPTESPLSHGAVDVAPGGFPLYERKPSFWESAIWAITGTFLVIVFFFIVMKGVKGELMKR
jgi:hypothetical protein